MFNIHQQTEVGIITNELHLAVNRYYLQFFLSTWTKPPENLAGVAFIPMSRRLGQGISVANRYTV